MELQLLLAAENPKLELLVLDAPDRHDMQDELWMDLLADFASSSREFAVVAIVSNVPYGWDGPVSYLGSLSAQPIELTLPAVEPMHEEFSGEEFVQEELDLDLPEPTNQVPLADESAREAPLDEDPVSEDEPIATETSEAKEN
ncbi:hypothetical protein [Glutamicibacter sp. M10]|uniref:hypothetical protein n=1 Tax=Glutamicibacter sp. M10 TaxID=3023076 RepID=UPI0021C6713B|nr:hypothetical protein [Glutamicibacter sp. M10]UXN32005.1 hypothetical protein N6V40_00315 [Glutamicibacter sp. M10]